MKGAYSSFHCQLQTTTDKRTSKSYVVPPAPYLVKEKSSGCEDIAISRVDEKLKLVTEGCARVMPFDKSAYRKREKGLKRRIDCAGVRIYSYLKS